MTVVPTSVLRSATAQYIGAQAEIGISILEGQLRRPPHGLAGRFAGQRRTGVQAQFSQSELDTIGGGGSADPKPSPAFNKGDLDAVGTGKSGARSPATFSKADLDAIKVPGPGASKAAFDKGDLEAITSPGSGGASRAAEPPPLPEAAVDLGAETRKSLSATRGGMTKLEPPPPDRGKAMKKYTAPVMVAVVLLGVYRERRLRRHTKQGFNSHTFERFSRRLFRQDVYCLRLSRAFVLLLSQQRTACPAHGGHRKIWT